MIKILSVIFSLFSISVIAVEYKYPVNDIPKELLENADAVVRFDQGQFDIISPGKGILKTKYAITILNKNANYRSAFTEYYDKSDKINSLSAKIYNAIGKCIRSANMKDFDDMSAVSGYSLYSDSRIKHTQPVTTEYPYTVEYICEKTIDGLLFYQNWYFISGYRASVQYSKYIVNVPASMGLRYKQVNFDSVPTIVNLQKNIQYTWECSNLKAIESEPYGPPLPKIIPHILFGPNKFEIEGYVGDMSTWQNLGKWQNQLLSGLDELPPETVSRIQELVKNCPDNVEKIKVIYNYVQKKTRYVAISLGIGGWQPFPAKVVDEVGYGDCKALSNYTISLLKAIGIRAYYTTVIAGDDEDDMVIDFPSKQTNHIIVCVPVEKDTIWLECTNKYSPFGYLGTFTDNRHVLVINENGGEIVKTPTYPKDSNIFIHKSNVEILPNGNAFANQQLIYKTLFYDEVDRFLMDDADQQKRWLYKNIEIPNFNIKSFSSIQYGDRYPTAVITENIDLPGYATKTGERIFVPLKLMDREINIPRKVAVRKSDIYIKRDYIRIDTICYKIPAGYLVEFKPGEFKVESVFGTCSSKVMQNGNEILYIRRSERNRGIFPNTEYNHMIDYYRQIAKADKEQLVLVKK